MKNNSTNPIVPQSARWKAMGLSFSIHFLLLAIVMLMVARMPGTLSSEPDRRGKIVLALETETQKTKYLEDSDEVAESLVPSQLPDFSSEPPPATAVEMEDLDIGGMIPIDNQTDVSGMTANTTGMGKTKPYELTKEDLELIAADQQLIQSRKPKGPETTISVFGTGGLRGRKFVFLIDRSKSMGEQGLGVLKQARRELTAAISKLEPHHQFQIVVYHNSTATISRRQLLIADQDNKDLVPKFLNNLVAFGGTNHQNGLYAALAFRPDVIVMMTDGGSPDLHQGHLDALSKAAGRTQIHAIQFGAGPPDGEPHFLMQLADSNGGTYRYVDVRQWLK